MEKELSQRIQANPLKYFWPHQRNCSGSNCDQAHITYETFDGKQSVIRGCPQYQFFNSKRSTKSFFGGNRAGKTTAGAVEAGYHSTGQYPDWWQGRKWDRPTRGRILVSDFAKGAKTISEKIKQFFPKDVFIHIEKNSLRAEVGWHIRHVSGGTSFFDLFTYEQDVALAEGWSGDWAWFDEPPSRSLYIATSRGLVDSDGLTLFTLTPLREPWLFDEIYNSKKTDIFSVLCDVRHNLVRKNPLTGLYIGLSENAIRKWEEKMTEEERETRIHGKFRYLAGRIWKEWDRDVHTFNRGKRWPLDRKRMIAVEGQPPAHWPRCLIIDPHDRNPHALLWLALSETGETYVYREAYLAEHTIEMAVEHIKNVELAARERVQLRIIDPNFGPKRYANSGNTVRDEFEQASRRLNFPMRFTFGDDHKEIGRKRVAEMLKFDTKKPLGLLNHPHLYIADDLKDCIYQIEHYVWDEDKSGAERNPKEKPRDLNDHFCDCLHYYAMANFRWQKVEVVEGRGNFYG